VQTEPNPPYRLKVALGLLIAGTIGVLLVVVAIKLFTTATSLLSNPDASASAPKPETSTKAPERPRTPKKIVAPFKPLPVLPAIPPVRQPAEANPTRQVEALEIERAEPLKAERPPLDRAEQIAPPPIERDTAVGKAPPLLGLDTKGSPVDLDDYKGKVVLVDFWASWCDPYVRNLPRIKEAYAKYHASGFEIIGVCLNDDPIWMSNFTRKNGMTWRQIQASDGYDSPLVVRWKVTDLPTAFLIGKDGKVSQIGVTGKDLARLIEAELKR
jgi:thiol-disulfide isomerase/thioredoxin